MNIDRTYRQPEPPNATRCRVLGELPENRANRCAHLDPESDSENYFSAISQEPFIESPMGSESRFLSERTVG